VKKEVNLVRTMPVISNQMAWEADRIIVRYFLKKNNCALKGDEPIPRELLVVKGS